MSVVLLSPVLCFRWTSPPPVPASCSSCLADSLHSHHPPRSAHDDSPKIGNRVAAQIHKLANARHDLCVPRRKPLRLVHEQHEHSQPPRPRAVLHTARVRARSKPGGPHVLELGAECCRVMLELLGQEVALVGDVRAPRRQAHRLAERRDEDARGEEERLEEVGEGGREFELEGAAGEQPRRVERDVGREGAVRE